MLTLILTVSVNKALFRKMLPNQMILASFRITEFRLFLWNPLNPDFWTWTLKTSLVAVAHTGPCRDNPLRIPMKFTRVVN